MKLKLFLMLIPFLLFDISDLIAQNLIPNGGFEFIDSKGNLTDWEKLTLNSPQLLIEDSIIPIYKGNRSEGIFLFDIASKNKDNRNFYQVKLTKPLKKGKRYRFTIYCKLSEYSTHSTKSFGANFSRNKFTDKELKSLLNNNPNLLFNQKVGTQYWNSKELQSSSDLKTWNKKNTVLVDVVYTAKGNEQYIILGNFSDSKSSYVFHIFNYGNNENTYIYYNIDEVSLTEIKPKIAQ